MVRTAENLSRQWTMLELMRDLRPGQRCGHRGELQINIDSDNTIQAQTENSCGTWGPFTVPGYQVAWRDVLEIGVPRSSLGPNQFVRPTHILLHISGHKFWVDNMP